MSAEPPAAAVSRLAFALRAFKNRNYRLFFFGQLVSLVGTWMQTMAQAWLVYRLTGSSFLLGAVAFCAQIPVLLFATVGGTVADRCDRRRIVMAMQVAALLQAAALAALTLTGRVQVWHVFCLAAGLGVINAFEIPARQAFVVDMVGKKDLINVIALNSSVFNGARLIGPAVAGLVVGFLGEGWCFLLNAVSFLAAIAGFSMMDVAPRSLPAGGAAALEHILEGLRFVWDNAPVRALLMLLGLNSLMGMPYMVLMPIFADGILHGGARGLGILMSAAGGGALLGALSLTSRSGSRGLLRLVPISAAVFGASLVLFSFSRSFWLSVALLIPVGFGLMVSMASTNTMIQTMVPDRLRGRVMAAYSMTFLGMAPLGALYAGSLAQALGAPITVALGGLLCMAGAGLFASRLGALRPEARRLIEVQDAAGEALSAAATQGGVK